MNVHVTIVAKTPVAGRVKTRLCPPCSYEQAAAIAAAGLADTIDAIDSISGIGTAQRTLLLEGARLPWMPAEYGAIPQRGHGLDERLRNGFTDLGPGVVIGMETPHMAHHLGDAIEAVRDGRDVLALAEDGGYWMIGLCERTVRRVDDVFAGIAMSTSHTGALQLQRLRELGSLPVLLLPTARDLDTFDDLCAIAVTDRVGRLAALARITVATVCHERSRLSPSVE